MDPKIDQPISPTEVVPHLKVFYRAILAIAVFLAVVVACTPAVRYYLALTAGTLALEALTQNPGDEVAFTTAQIQLERARVLAPTDPMTLRRLGQFYRRTGQSDAAVAALSQAAIRLPQSLLVKQELALAAESAGDTNLVDKLLAELDLAPDQIAPLVRRSFEQGAYQTAADWCPLAERFSGRRPDQDYLCAVASSVTLAPDAESRVAALLAAEPSLRPIVVNNGSRVRGDQLRWATEINEVVSYGTPLSFGKPPDGNGYMWWSGHAIAWIEVTYPGTYLWRLEAQHTLPAPVELVLGLDGVKVSRVSLGRGDNTFEMLETLLELRPGLHTLNIWYINDAEINGQNRDGVFRQFELIPYLPR